MKSDSPKEPTFTDEPSFSLVSATDYYQDLLKRIPKTKKRIVLAAMLVLWGEQTDAIFAEVEKALKRGIKVHILLDNYTKLAMSSPSLSKSSARLYIKKTMLVLEELRKKGAKVSFVGKIGIIPFKGRCHIKITIVDDHCYSFGGVNFSDKHLKNSDYMLYTQDAELGDCLEQLVERVAAQYSGAMPNAELSLGGTSSILFDGGQPKDSIIYDRACELAADAKKAYFVSQYAPSGRLAPLLNKTSATFYFNQPEIMSVPDRWGQAFDQQRHRTPNSYDKSRHVHAKYILFEMKDGTKALISGSNNFSWRGVAFGTKEIALYSTNEKLWQQLFTFAKEHIDHSLTQ